MFRLAPRKRPIIAALENGEGFGSTGSKKLIYNRREPRNFPLCGLPCDMKKVITLPDQWINNRTIILPEVYLLPLVKTRRTLCITLNTEKRAMSLSNVFLVEESLYRSKEVLF